MVTANSTREINRLKKAALLYERHCTMATSIALAILAIVVLFHWGQLIMNSIEGSQANPMYVEK
jgi:hypothetical protein